MKENDCSFISALFIYTLIKKVFEYSLIITFFVLHKICNIKDIIRYETI